MLTCLNHSKLCIIGLLFELFPSSHQALLSIVLQRIEPSSEPPRHGKDSRACWQRKEGLGLAPEAAEEVEEAAEGVEEVVSEELAEEQLNEKLAVGKVKNEEAER
ncbi:hypothetical protein IAT38_007545 [Cryptococcus sp. DSM 104549]